jgi:hypothetical protein
MTAGAQAINLKLKYVEEVTSGVTPSAALRLVRNTGSSFNFNIATVQSQELVSTADVQDIVPSAGTSGGDLNIEYSFAEYRPFVASVLRSAFSTPVALTATTIGFTLNTITSSANAFVPANLLPGMWVSISGSSVPANNGIAKIVSTTAGAITVSHKTFTVSAAGPNVTIKSLSVRNGTTPKTFSFEEQYTDLSSTFVYYKGMMATQLTLNAASGQIVSGAFAFQGMDAGTGTGTIGTGADLAATTNPLMNAVNNLGTVFIDGSPATGVYFKSINLTANNQPRTLDAIGNLFPICIGTGTLDAKFAVVAYFEDVSFFTKLRNSTGFSLSYSFLDSAGNRVVVDAPRVKVDTASLDGKAINSDVMQNLSFTVLRDTVSPYALQISEI